MTTGLAPWSRPTLSTDTCVGTFQLAGYGRLHAVRNPGGGSSSCCSHYPVAAGARTFDDEGVELQLLPGTKRSPRGDQSRLLVSPERRRRGDSEDHADSPEHLTTATTRDGLTLL